MDGSFYCTIPGTEKIPSIDECKRAATLTPILNGSKVSYDVVEERKKWESDTQGQAKPWSSMRQQAAGSKEKKIRAGT
jgi:hypothetical protein